MEKNRINFRIILGVLLAYQGFSLVKDVLGVKPEHYMLYAAAGAAFIIIGLVWSGLGLKQLVQKEREERNSQKEEKITEIAQDSEREE